ncbi:hypothetical protein ABPG72_010618 [Tetrahymena utriculariae]
MQKTDLFGRENQGQNYDKYRPKYPSKIFDLILKDLNSKDNYLDVGCGIGQMLFKLNSHFKIAVGTDVSEKQNQNSRFAVAAYYWDGFDIDINNELLSGKQINELYQNQIKDYYDFYKDNLYSNYKHYPFNKYFEQISDDSFIEKDIFQLDDLVRYMKTRSAYNNLMEKNSSNPFFEDPITKVQNQISEKIIAYKRQHNLSENTPYKILRRTYYFLKVFKRI